MFLQENLWLASKNSNGVDALINEIGKLNPAEIIANNNLYKDKQIKELIESKFDILISPYPNKYFNYNNAENKIKYILKFIL